MEQRSDEWYRARCGQLGASQIHIAIAKGKGSAESATRKNLMAELIAMRLTGDTQPTFVTQAMQWGIDNEPIARAMYEARNDVLVDEHGWIPHPDIDWTGCSPDGLVGDDGMIEIKCPNTATHIEWVLSASVPAQHKLQMLWQMEVTGRKWCDFVSYDPRMPKGLDLYVIRYTRDQDRINDVKKGVILFLEELADKLSRLEELNYEINK